MGKILNFCKIGGKNVEKFDGERKYIATGDIVDNNIVSFTKVTYSNKPSRANQNVDVGDILFAKMINTNKVIMIDEDNAGNIYSTGFFVLKPKENIYCKYLYWLLNSSKFNNEKDKNCNGATQKALNSEGLKKIYVSEVPSISEQQKIVKKIDKIYEVISLKKEQIKNLNEIIKSQFVEYAIFKELEVA